eukprot:1238162-Rhodomonas_salina.1
MGRPLAARCASLGSEVSGPASSLPCSPLSAVQMGWGEVVPVPSPRTMAGASVVSDWFGEPEAVAAPSRQRNPLGSERAQQWPAVIRTQGVPGQHKHDALMVCILLHRACSRGVARR